VPPPPAPPPTWDDFEWSDELVWPPTELSSAVHELAPRTASWINGTLQFTRERLIVIRSRTGMFGLGKPGVDEFAFDQICAADLHGSTLTLMLANGSRRAVHGIVQRDVVAEALRQRGIEAAPVELPVAIPGA
jgi:hypothetical protein